MIKLQNCTNHILLQSFAENHLSVQQRIHTDQFQFRHKLTGIRYGTTEATV